MADKITPEQLAERIDALEATNAELAETNAELRNKLAGIVADQLKKEPAKPVEVPKELLDHKGSKYKVMYSKFKLAGAEYLATELFTDEKLAAQLLAVNGQAVLIEQK